MSTELAIGVVDLEARAEAAMAPLMQKVNALQITSMETYLAADGMISMVREAVGVRETELGPTKKSATETWQNACALWKKYVTDPLEACKVLDRKRTAWKRDEDRKREEAAEKARREEQKRLADEKLALAARLDSAGMKEQATAVLDAPIAPVAVPEPVKVETPKGQTIIECWQGRVVDADAVPRDFCSPDLVKIGRYAKLMKGKAVTPGVVYEDVGSVRRKA